MILDNDETVKQDAELYTVIRQKLKKQLGVGVMFPCALIYYVCDSKLCSFSFAIRGTEELCRTRKMIDGVLSSEPDVLAARRVWDLQNKAVEDNIDRLFSMFLDIRKDHPDAMPT